MKCSILLFAFLAFLIGCGSNQSSSPNKGKTGSPASQARAVVPGDDDLIELSSKGLGNISSYGTTYFADVAKAGVLPRGSALITRSGNLAKSGIKYIIHAASGSSGNNTENFIPTLNGVSLSINNSLRLARKQNVHRVAVPFVGRGIFLTRIGATVEELAETIIRASLANRGDLEICFILSSKRDAQLFRDTVSDILSESGEDYQDVAGAVEVVQGDVVSYADHKADAIINAANMEVRFGSGMSGAIGSASGDQKGIDAEARKLIQAFNKKVLQRLKKKGS